MGIPFVTKVERSRIAATVSRASMGVAFFACLATTSAKNQEVFTSSYPVLGSLPSHREQVSGARGLMKLDLNEVKAEKNKRLKMGKALVGSPDEEFRATIAGLIDSLGGVVKIAKVETDYRGNRHIRLVQYVGGLEVRGGELIIHVDSKNELIGVSGELIRSRVNTAFARTVSDVSARQIAIAEVVKFDSAAKVQSSKQVVFNGSVVYEISIKGGKTVPTNWHIYVDAATGELLYGFNSVAHAGPTSNGSEGPVMGSLLTGEGGAQSSVNGWYENNGKYYLYSFGKKWGVYNEDLSDWEQRTTPDWGTSDRAAFSLAKNMESVQNYVSTKLRRNSYDNNGAFCKAIVHVGSNYVNAYWDGSALSFGDGDGSTAGPLGVLDIAGHEFGHAITTYSSNLVYSYESGALNEAYSDILGTLIEFYAQPDGRAAYPNKTVGAADYLCGEDAWLSGVALRDLKNPQRFGQPSSYLGSYWATGSGDNGGVHTNSGVANFAFYLLAEGGNGVNNGNSYSINGLGYEKSGEIAMYANMYLHTSSDGYAAAREHWITAARILGYDTATVSAVWTACGVRAPVRNIAFNETSHAFGSVGVGSVDTFRLVLSNSGTIATTVSAMNVADSQFKVLESLPVTVPGGGSQTVRVLFAPVARGPVNSDLVILSNATNLPEYRMPLSGNGTNPSMISLSKSVFDKSLATGTSARDTLTIANSGEADLTYLLSIVDSSSVATIAAPAYSEYHFAPLTKGQIDTREGLATASAVGGPDQFGYKWKDSDAPGGPAYTWQDISVSGTRLTSVSGCDDCYEPASLSFSFPYYGTNYSSLYVSSNGYVTFGQGSNAYSNYPLPSTSNPTNMIAPFFDDLNTGTGGDVYFKDFGTYAIIQYEQVAPYSGSGTFSFQIVLNKSGKINYFYKSMIGSVSSATVGVQNVTGSTGLQVAYNNAYVISGKAVEISARPEWVTVTPTSGSVVSGQNQSVVLSFNESNVEPGTYTGKLTVVHNAANREKPISIPVKLTVGVEEPITVVRDTTKAERRLDTVRVELRTVEPVELDTVVVRTDSIFANDTMFVRTDSLRGPVIISSRTDTTAYRHCMSTLTDTTILQGPGPIRVEVDTTVSSVFDTVRSVIATVDEITRDTLVVTSDSVFNTVTRIIQTDSLRGQVLISSYRDTTMSRLLVSVHSDSLIRIHVPVYRVTRDTTVSSVADTARSVSRSVDPVTRDTLEVTTDSLLTTVTRIIRTDSLRDDVVFRTYSDTLVENNRSLLRVDTIVIVHVPVISVNRDTAVTTSYDSIRTVVRSVDPVTKDTAVVTNDSLLTTVRTVIRTDSLRDDVVFTTLYDTLVASTKTFIGSDTVIIRHIPVISVRRDTAVTSSSAPVRNVSSVINGAGDTVVTTIDSLYTTVVTTIQTDSLSDGIVFATRFDTAQTVTGAETVRSSVTKLRAPVITTNPVNKTVAAGASVSFSVVATGTSLTYQWKKNGTAISGATAATLTFTAQSTDNTALYSCTVRNSGGELTSSAAKLTVTTPQYKAWDPNQHWTEYKVGDLRTNAGKLWKCTNVGYSFYEPSSVNGKWGWAFVSNL